jgi:hyperosmotically inducible protein
MKQLNKYLSAVFLAVTLGSAVGCASTATEKGTGEYIDDAVITTKVKTALIEDPVTKAYQIEVETYKGVVQLSGFVATQAEANKAGQVARGVAGVTSVKNDIRIK